LDNKEDEMKARMKYELASILLCFVFVFLGSVKVALAEENQVTEDGFIYSSYDQKICSIDGYQGEGGSITIPKKIDGMKVTAISMNAFKDNTTITEVTISEGVANIYNEAFENCSNLEVVNLPSTVTGIYYSFASCEKLSKFTVAKKNKSYYTTDGILMQKY